MGQKVHPIGIRLGITRGSLSRYYVDRRHYASFVLADCNVRKELQEQFSAAGISRIEIERPARNARIVIHAARPGVIIGKSGRDIDDLRAKLQKELGVPVQIDVEEVKKPELDAQLVADSISAQLLKRTAFRKAIKRAVSGALRAGAKGIKVRLGGRIAGAEIARCEWVREGRVPLHTLRAEIDYGCSRALTTYGYIGVKVWIFKGEKLEKEEQSTTSSKKE